MNDAERQTRSRLMSLFSEHGFHPRTDLGQNFLIDLNLIEYVVDKSQLSRDDVVLEIGTGTGGMTAFLASQAGAVISVEVDSRVHALAREILGTRPNLSLLLCDALRNKNNFAPEVLAALRERLTEAPGRQLKLVANLPYCIATPVISNLVTSDFPWTMMVVTIQWELADRMRALPGTDEYGALSVWLQSQAEVRVLKKLKPTVFWPRPGVESAIVRITRLPASEMKLQQRGFFHDFIRRVFHHRRKSLRSVLVGMYSKQFSKSEIDAILAPRGWPGGVRVETLDIPTLIDLGNTVQAALEAKGLPLPTSPVTAGLSSTANSNDDSDDADDGDELNDSPDD